MTRRLGATPHDDGSCSFCVWAPHAQRVDVLLGGDDGRSVRLSRARTGYHLATVAGVGAGHRYAYLLDDDPLQLPDPASACQPDGVHAMSQVVDHRSFEWSDSAWHGLPLRELVTYELHVGTFTPAGTFDAVIERLDELHDDGFTAIELMPVAAFPGARNWGYDGVDLFAAHSAYGGPDGLRRLVDAAHAHGIAVVLDVVYNHLGPEGNYLSRFGPYFSDRHSTPWGQAMNLDGPGSDEVRRFFVENALQWVRDFHIDALRLDAIHGIVDTSAVPFLAELADAVADEADRLNRRAWLIAESDLNDVRVVVPRECGGIGHDAQWTDDFHHALHTQLTGERDGYYADYRGLCDLATSYRQGFVYTGQPSRFRGRRHGSSSAGLPGERFVVYAQNHDQIGNRMQGDRLAAGCSAAQLKLAAAAVALSPFLPMFFMGEEYAETAPFPYFVSHGDPALVEAVRQGRLREFASFQARGTPPDPQSEATFEQATLDWGLRRQEGHAEHLAFTRALLQLRRRSPSIRRLRPAETVVTSDEQAGWITLHRTWDDEHTLVVLNFGSEAAARELLAGTGEGWRRVLDSEEQRFGGAGVDEQQVAPASAAVFRREEEL